MKIISHYRLLINIALLTAFLPIFGSRAAMWVKDDIQFNLKKAAELKNYLENKKMIIDGDAYEER